MKKAPIETIDAYIALLPNSVGVILQTLRQTIMAAAPEAKECISYGMPAYKLKGILVYFAVHKNHIGFYPTASGIDAFEKELTKYHGAKGSVQFPLDKPLPLELISRIVKFRVKENMEKA
jgi:uncharacterized protein YdhG (YjbR/CyaY superfamily)